MPRHTIAERRKAILKKRRIARKRGGLRGRISEMKGEARGRARKLKKRLRTGNITPLTSRELNLSPEEIRRQIERRFGRTLPSGTLTRILNRSKLKKIGGRARIQPVSPRKKFRILGRRV